MVMKSRFCSSFTKLVPKSFAKAAPSVSSIGNGSTLQWAIKFTTSHWEPYIDRARLSPRSNESTVCGPLLGVLIEIANSLNVNISLVDKNGDYFDALHEGLVHILLSPLFPYAFRNVTHLYRVGSTLGESPMFSILSAEHHPDDSLGLRSFSAFNGPFILLYFLTWFTINMLALILAPYEYFYKNFGLNLLRMALRQPAIGSWFNSKAKISLLVLNFLFLTLFFDQFVSNVFLNLLTVEPLVDRIESVKDLVARPNIKLCMFSREISVPVIDELSRTPFYQNFQGRSLPQSPAGSTFHQWINWVIDETSKDRMALISEKLYLDYLDNHYRQLNYLNLHRSKANLFNFPYFLGVKRSDFHRFLIRSNSSQEELNFYKHESLNLDRLYSCTNRIITNLVESGIFEYWIAESLYLNQPPSAIMQLEFEEYYNYNQDPYHTLVETPEIRIDKEIQSFRVLDFDDVNIIFSMYVGANIFATVVMMVEMIINRWHLLRDISLARLFNLILENPFRLDRISQTTKKSK